MFSNIKNGLLGLFYLFVSENVGRKFVRTKKCHGTLEVTKKEKTLVLHTFNCLFQMTDCLTLTLLSDVIGVYIPPPLCRVVGMVELNEG